MRHIKTILFIMIFTAAFISTIHAQDTTVVETTSGNEFAPAGVVIKVGDYIKWVNASEGLHNVIADDGSFDSGDPSTARWEYVVQFNTVGFFNYYCDVHGGPNATGMSGFVQVEQPTSVDDETKKLDFRLEQNYPNPFNPNTRVSYALPKHSDVSIKIYDMLGREVKTLVNEFKNAGIHETTWNGENNYGTKVPSGTYIYVIKAGEFYQAKKMIMLK